MTSPTSYVETNALLAAQQGDTEEAERLLATMFRGERRILRDAALDLITLIDRLDATT